MTKELEQRRAEACTKNEAYLAQIDSMEPDIVMVDPGAFHASAAISLKRIADVADLFALSLLKDHKAKDDSMRDWARRHGFGDLWDKMS
jgi:hypothetical protein